MILINTSLRKHRLRLAGRILVLCIPLLLFAAVGVRLLDSSHAATPTASFQVEGGTVGGPATTVADSSASGGSAVKFTASAGIPAQCASGGTYLWANLETCGWPGPANTGYVLSECGGSLTTSTLSKDAKGVIHITANNTTVSCQSITGCVSVEATGVTIKNNLIKGCNGFNIRDGANGTGTITVDDGASATVTQNELNGQKQVHACVWYSGTSLTATKNNCYNIDDGMFSWWDSSMSATAGDGFTIRDNYIHDLTTATANGHIDGYQTEGAANGLIDHNTFLMTTDDGNGSDSAIAIWNSQKSSHDITAQNNLITGGGFAIYAEDYDPSEASPAGGKSVTNIFFTNNKFSTKLFGGTCVGYYGVWYPRGAPSDQWRRSGNKVLETGFNLDNGNPSGCN